MAYRVEVNVEDCISSGKCVADFPGAFGFDDEELSQVLPGVSDLTDDEILRAARNCPSRAIVVYDDDGDVVVT